ncbi:MAG: DUF192 domain-containing protein [Dehalococcoidia bacterium]|nr:DUF192 domain-containing protein [Dehalococcoidia bacterium]
MLRLLLNPFLVLAALFCGCDDGDGRVAVLLEVRDGQGNTAEVSAELAVTPEQRQRGLMFREELGEDDGMLFLFPGQSSTGFWMRNTYVPLDIAYLGEDGTVQEIRHGVPESEEVLTPEEPYRYVLEVNRGWFEENGFGVGDRVVIPEALDAIDVE